MKKPIILIQILLMQILIVSVFASVSAGFESYQRPIITINSPLSNETCASSSVPLAVWVDVFGLYSWDSDNIKSLSYSLDGHTEVPLILTLTNGGAAFKGNDTIFNVSDGIHSIYVHGLSIRNNSGTQESVFFNSSTTFVVNATMPNKANHTSIISPSEPNDVVTIVIVVLTVVVVLIVIVSNTEKVQRFMKPMRSYGS
jgi:hypothetical protein